MFSRFHFFILFFAPIWHFANSIMFSQSQGKEDLHIDHPHKKTL